jgi:hypothetical protein
MPTPTAPAALAFATFWLKVQAPRLMSASLPQLGTASRDSEVGEIHERRGSESSGGRMQAANKE